MADHVRAQNPAPVLVALAAILPADAAIPIRLHRMPEGIVAAYSPEQETRASVWAMLVELFGPLRDISVAGA